MTVLSLCMIVKNEERHLSRCLESVRDLVDEIVIVDTGSSDRTPEIARSFGAHVFFQAWEDDFSKARNFSIDQATGDWILVLDADEVISREDHAALRHLMENRSAVIYRLIQTTYCDESANFGWVPNHLASREATGYPGYIESPLARLFRKMPQIRFQGVVHEHARHEDDPRVHEVATPIRIHHYGKYDTESDRERKNTLYLRLGVEKCEKEPRNAQAHYELGAQLWSMGRLSEAKKSFLKARDLDPHYPSPLTALASIATTEKDYREAVRYFLRLIEVDPKSVVPYLYLPTLLIELGEIAFAENVLKLGYPFLKDHPSYHVNRGVVMQSFGNYRGSLEAFREALRLNPHETLAWVNIGVSLTELEEWTEAETSLQKAVHESPSAISYQKFVGLYFKKRDLDRALDVVREGILLFPKEPELRYQESVILIQKGDLKKARESLSKIQSYQEFGNEGLKRLMQCYRAVGDHFKAQEMEALCKLN